jgi:CheY-like chemotaxis protein
LSSIVVVDDIAGSRHFMAAALSKGGHEVREVEPTCLFKVLEALHQAPPDLLITDLIMPDCPGHTVIRACREDPHLKNLKILLLTAHGDDSLGRFLQSMGNVHYLAKPVSPAMLLECSEMLMSQDLETDPGWALACRGVVAIVDDSQLTRAFHAACLRKQGFRGVQINPTGLLETVLAIEQAQPDLLMVDFMMPMFRGDALIRAIRARESLRAVPILVVTAHQSEELVSQLQVNGGVEVAFKPIFPDDLISRVRSILAKP